MKCKRRLYSLRFFILPSLLVPEFFIVDFILPSLLVPEFFIVDFILPSLLVPEFFIVDFNYAAAIGQNIQ